MATTPAPDTTTAPPCWDCPIPPPQGVPTGDELAAIASDAAHRASELLHMHESADPPWASSPDEPAPGPLDPVTDLVRLLRHTSDKGTIEIAATRAGLRTGQLRTLRAAFAFHGEAGVRAVLHCAEVDPSALEHAARQLASVRSHTRTPLHCEHNRITDLDAGIQLRLVNDTWYPFTRTPQNGWAPARGAAQLPTAAYSAARLATRSRSA
ncbi:hypothetical protein [Streptomyces noursei]|uniref:Uncharacterized protein n=1 Tax=Streptomyces noursei TaxID=1971 RepID=A0A401RAU9_STRNR|nr:hypothetical protein [Streptomyces noursei]UWS75412.1 hypothetical protein N1H47_31800 [Streptomyces noursei]GCB94717.1 hypothetical protein SALB_07518 [Streptomyces noursei]